MMRMVCVVGIVIFLGDTFGCGDSGTSRKVYQEKLRAAAACTEGDVCVIGGGIQCVCAEPINQNQESDLRELAKDVNCDGIAVSCIGRLNPRCENNVCVADPG